MRTGMEPTPVLGPRALVVTHDRTEARRIAGRLETAGLAALAVLDGDAALRHLDEGPIDIVVSEASGPRIDGVRLLHAARLRNPHVCVIWVIDPEEIEPATRAMEDGVHDFQLRPLNLDKIAAVARRGLEQQRLHGRLAEMHRRLDHKFGLEGLVGESPAVTAIWRKVRRVAAGDANVLIIGESGTGKGRLARAIHQSSPRREGPLVFVDCRQLPDAMVLLDWCGRGSSLAPAGPESKMGAFLRADKGVLVLEGVHALSMSLQDELLAILSERRIRPIGAEQRSTFDVRLIATSQVDLRTSVQAHRFREELFYRLNVVAFYLPPLRQRPQDVAHLLQHLFETSVDGTVLPTPGVTGRALDLLCRYGWPGNVRELKDVVAAMLVGWDGTRLLDVGDLPAVLRDSSQDPGHLSFPADSPLRDIERRAIESALIATGYDRRRAAARLQMSLRTFYRRLRVHGITAPRPERNQPR